jgi:DNA-directed RNA polymerase subunit RPC12/RpoP
MYKCENCGNEFIDPDFQQDPDSIEFETVDCCPCCGSLEIYEKEEEDIYEDGLEDYT